MSRFYCGKWFKQQHIKRNYLDFNAGPAEKGRDLLKQVRIHLVETARPVMEAMIEETTGVKVVSLHHDISTVTGEEVVLFTPANSPVMRESRR
jgi:hypothetical protein